MENTSFHLLQEALEKKNLEQVHDLLDACLRHRCCATLSIFGREGVKIYSDICAACWVMLQTRSFATAADVIGAAQEIAIDHYRRELERRRDEFFGA
jgi:hypothetical protein